MTHPVRGAIFWWLEARAKSAVKKWCERHKKHHMVHTDYRQHHTNRKHQSSAQRFAAHLNAQKHVPSLKNRLADTSDTATKKVRQNVSSNPQVAFECVFSGRACGHHSADETPAHTHNKTTRRLCSQAVKAVLWVTAAAQERVILLSGIGSRKRHLDVLPND